jgi:hypothetical protein
MEFTMTTLEMAHDFPMIDGIPVYPIFGSEGGYHTAGDVLVDKTVDGVPLEKVWDTLREVLGAWKAKQDAFTSLLAFETTEIAEAIPQTLGKATFEKASEFGVPKASQAGDFLLCGYGFDDYDHSWRATWKFLRDATARQIESGMNSALEADQRLRSGKILQRLFNPTQLLTPESNPERGLFNGTDGIAPLEWLGQTFASDHSHYLVSGNATLDSSDVEDSMSSVLEHGFGSVQGSRILVFASQTLCDQIASWRKGEESRAGGPVAKFDFVPSSDAPPFLSSEFIVGTTPPSEYNNLRVMGSYGHALIVPHILVPNGYLLTVATSGPNHPDNVIGLRHHVNPAYQGLRVIPGNQQGYPLIESYWQRSFGVGVRQRGAAVVMQVKASGAYDTPEISI